MKNQKFEQTDRIQKYPYESPKATFVPLKLQERLLQCLPFNPPQLS